MVDLVITDGGLSLISFPIFYFPLFSISILAIIWSCRSPHTRRNLQIFGASDIRSIYPLSLYFLVAWFGFTRAGDPLFYCVDRAFAILDFLQKEFISTRAHIDEFMVTTRTGIHSGAAHERSIMEATRNVVESSNGDLSSMAPLMTMLAEMQRELGDLRRQSRNSSSDNEGSDDGLTSDPLADASRTFAEEELLARTYNGLLPTICHDPRFRRILDYRYYRLHKRSPRYDAEVAGRVAKWTRQLEASLKLRFDGSDPLAVLQFLHAFVEAANTNGIKEGAAVYLLRSFLDSPAREEFTAARATAFPVAVDWLLTTFAPVSALAAEHKAISSLAQGQRESPREFGLRLRQRASRLGPLMDETAVTILMEGLDPSLSGFVQSALRNQKPTFTNVLQEAELVFSSVQATARRSEDSQSVAAPAARATMSASTRGLPTYNRTSRREVAPVLAVDHGPYDAYPDWMARQYAESEFCLEDWDSEGENVEQVLLAQVLPPQRVRYCYTCWKPGHFSAECPLIPDSERAAIALRRAAVLKLRPPRFTRPQPPSLSAYPSRPIHEPEKPPMYRPECPPEVSSVAVVVPENLKPAEERTRPPRSH